MAGADNQAEAHSLSRRCASAGRRLLVTVFVLLVVVGLVWFGRAWSRYEADRAAAAHRAAELQRQIDEQRRETTRIETARRRAAEEAEAKRIAAEKARAEKARLAAERRAREEAARTEIARDESAPVQTPPPAAAAAVAPEQAEKKTVFTFEEAAPEEEKDYGPIPKRTYAYLKGGRADSPQPIAFALANGATIDLVPLKAATFFMSNDWRDGRTHHKVTLTRPFWMSKYLVTATQWREFAPNDCADCRPVEKALEGTPYTVSKAVSCQQIDAFCAYLSAKYRTQLPKGYVFRLPTEAEWEYALDLPGTERLYADRGGWDACVNYSSPAGFQSMRDLRRAKNLDAVCAWSDDEAWGRGAGMDKTLTIFVGGRMQPFASGVFDFRRKVCPFLDTVEGNWRYWEGWAFRTDVVLPYGDTAVDPLRRAPPSAKSVRTLYRENLYTRKASDPRRRVFFHLVLGPDLLAERAWARAPSEPPKPVRRAPLAMRPQKWDPKKTPRKLNRPRTYAFELDNGAKMAFCLCPAGTFNMSNIEGQGRRFHRVTLTRPFLITTYSVTAAQWRDFGRHDCEGVARELEALFAKGKDPLPVCVQRNRIQWTRYCDHLNARYRSILPEGYVFRLPTEAELEWAMLADENGSAYDLDWTRFCDDNPRIREDLARRLKRLRFADVRHFDLNGWYRGCYVGGRTTANAWGFRDFRMSNVCLDLLDADWRKDPEQLDCKRTGQAYLVRDRPYLDHETDPLRWDGRRSGFPLARHRFSARVCGGNDMFNMYLAHLVIGPDLEGALRRQEEGPYPEVDFGGRFIGDRAKLTEMSSREPHPANLPERHRLLLSRENTLVRTMDLGEDLRGCHTQKEPSPWILIELEKPVTLAGIQVEAFTYRWLTRHLRIWAADEDRKMRLIASDDRELCRHRFDLNSKNVRAKYIRIGREPGFNDDYFSLDKVLIYAKPGR